MNDRREAFVTGAICVANNKKYSSGFTFAAFVDDDDLRTGRSCYIPRGTAMMITSGFNAEDGDYIKVLVNGSIAVIHYTELELISNYET